MRIALIGDTYPPLRTSGAVQLRDLSREFVRQGHEITVLLPSSSRKHWELEEMDGVKVLRLGAPRTKDISYVRRTIGELLMPYAMLRNLRRSPLASIAWEGVVWYAPSIFHGPLAKALKSRSACPGYLIVRDIFPEWAVDMGLMGRGLPYMFFNAVARYQYAVADVIGVQTPGNLPYFDEWSRRAGRRVEVLPNWLGLAATSRRCPIRVDNTRLAGRKIFVYAGNMGVAQGMDIVLKLASDLRSRKDIGFVFVGRGSDAKRLAGVAERERLDNALFFDEIDPDQIPDLYAQCHVGLVSLDARHRSHNIPGKFLTYMQSGLPVLANVNRGNDLAEIIRRHKVGMVCEDNSVETLHALAEGLLRALESDEGLPMRCVSLFQQCFAVEAAVRQIASSLAARGVVDDLLPREA